VRNWQRKFKLDITLPDGTLWTIDSDNTNLRIAFSSTQSLKREPDQTNIMLFNLNAEFRARLHNSLGARLVLSAGYQDHCDVIFRGDISQANSRQDDTGTTWTTTIDAGAGEVRYRTSKISQSFSKSMSRKDIIRQVASIVGYNTSKVDEYISGIEDMAPPVRGVALSGVGVEAMSKVLPQGWSFTIDKDDGYFIYGPSTIKSGPMLVLNAQDSGIIGTPEVSTKDKSTGKVTVKLLTQLYPAAQPGVGIQINLPDFQGQTYRAEEVVFTGDSWDGVWVTEYHCKKI